MTDQTSNDRLTQIEPCQQRQDETVAPIDEILLLTAQRQERKSQQIAANTEGLAELRALWCDR